MARLVWTAQRLRAVREQLLRERTAESLRRTDSMGALAAAAGAPPAPLTESAWARACGLSSVSALRDALAAGDRARNELVQRNMGMAVSVATRFRSAAKLPFADLVQEGAAGLVHATERFDPNRGYRFATYAFAWVETHVRRAIQNEGRTVRVPVWVYEVRAKVLAARQALQASGGGPPTAQQVAQHTGIPLYRVVEADASFAGEASLDDSLRRAKPGREVTLGDSLASPVAAGGDPAHVAERDVAAALAASDVGAMLDTLPDGERLVLTEHFGLGEHPAGTVKEVAARLQLTSPVVYRLLRSGLQKMRHPQRAGYLQKHFEGAQLG